QEIYKDRQKFSEQVFNVASSDLVNMGISVVSYTLKDIHDDQEARGTWGHGGGGHVDISAVSGTGDTGAGLGTAAERDGDGAGPARLPSAAGAVRRRRQRPQSSGRPGLPAPGTPDSRFPPLGHLGVARTKQQIEEQRAQVLVVERAQQAQLQEHEIGRRERELEATVRKPAEAERYRLERLAEAQR
ncbi:FLOT1 protein, partial [Himantopus himantopus]|nr:FLOT1 protein [Himantopus himantopus]